MGVCRERRADEEPGSFVTKGAHAPRHVAVMIRTRAISKAYLTELLSYP